MTADVLARLRAELGDRVDTSPAALEDARADKSGHRSAGAPLAVVHAASIGDVQATLRIASESGTPVVTRGAGTGLAGGANAGPGEIALSTRRMTRILEVRPDDLLAVVEPGILNAELNAALAEHGLWWAPDPASRAISTVGGNIATGAGGLLCAKYGVVRDAVLGVDLVLADGRLLSLGHRSVKGVTGLDLTSLVIGSEGTLGVIVGATLKLRRLVPGVPCTVAATFPDVRAAAAASSAVTAAGLQPAIMELMDAASLEAVHRLLALPAPTPGASQLTIQTDGPGADVEADAIAAVLIAAGGTVVAHARPRRGRAPARDPPLDAPGDGVARHDADRGRLGAPQPPAGDVRRDRPRRARPRRDDPHGRPRRATATCIRTSSSTPPLDGEVPAYIWDAADDLFRAALRLGGTLTGEHGIGLLKRRWLADELGDDQWRLQREITRVFDPQGILNPGKVFAP